MKVHQGLIWGTVGFATGFLVAYVASSRDNSLETVDHAVRAAVADVCDPKIAAAPVSQRPALIAARTLGERNARESKIIETFTNEIKASSTNLPPKIASMESQFAALKNDLNTALACTGDQTGLCKDAKLQVGAILEKQQSLLEQLHSYLLGSPQQPSPFAALAQSTDACTASNAEAVRLNSELTTKLDQTTKTLDDVVDLAKTSLSGDREALLVPTSVRLTLLSQQNDTAIFELKAQKTDTSIECRTMQLGVELQTDAGFITNTVIFAETLNEEDGKPEICTTKIRIDAEIKRQPAKLRVNVNTANVYLLRQKDHFRPNRR
jgi:hypothetical protein